MILGTVGSVVYMVIGGNNNIADLSAIRGESEDKMTQEELNKILENHKHWLNEDCEGWQDMRAYLTEADLRRADLREADLRGADLRRADLGEACLEEACLTGADLGGAGNVPFIPYSCPDFGMFIGYKKASGYIVELEIPEDAKRVSATSRKCRCDKAKVLRILHYDRTVAAVTEVASSRDCRIVYKVGELVSVAYVDEDRWNECSTGIRSFINFQAAVSY